MKTILVPIEHHAVMNAILESAFLLGKKFDSYIEGFAPRIPSPIYYMAEPAGGLVIEKVQEDVAEKVLQARILFETFMQSHGVRRSDQTKATLSFGWFDQERAEPGFVGSYGRVFDVIALGRPTSDPRGPYMDTLEAAIFESGRPIFVAPPSPPQRLGEHILIAWNCSTEQARATALAMPLLQRARRVTVLTVEGGTVQGPTGEQLMRCLSFNAVPAEHRTVAASGRSTGEAILAEAETLGCDLLIKGAYTQSRLRQWIFGGATRHILTHATLPVLIAH